MAELYIITEEGSKEAFKDLSNQSLILLYSISQYHEKYIFTNWIMNELISRGFSKRDIKITESTLTKFYNALLLQENL